MPRPESCRGAAATHAFMLAVGPEQFAVRRVDRHDERRVPAAEYITPLTISGVASSL